MDQNEHQVYLLQLCDHFLGDFGVQRENERDQTAQKNRRRSVAVI